MLDFQAYLLAAGNGERAGGPKAWRKVDGGPLLRKQIDFLLGIFKPESVAVTIQKEWLNFCRELSPSVRWTAADPRSSPLSALRALMGEAPLSRWTFLHHVDMPVWEPALFELLAARVPEAETSGLEAIAPAYQGRKGHPVLLSPRLEGPLLGLDPARDRLDHFLRTRREDALELPFSCIHENWNS